LAACPVGYNADNGLEMLKIVAFAGIVGALSGAFSQSVNIEFGTAGTAPSSNYGAAGLAGFWNNYELLPAWQRFPVKDLSGASGAVEIYQYGISTMLFHDNPATNGDDEALLDDMAISYNNPVDACVWIDHLLPGRYEVLIYAMTPNNPALQSRCRVDNATTGPVMVGGQWTGAHIEGITYSKHTVIISDGLIGLHSGLYGGVIQSGINGLQLKHFGSPFDLTVEQLSVGPGFVITGNMASLAASDDDRLVMQPGPVLLSTAPPLQMIVETTSPNLQPYQFTMRTESSASINGLQQIASLWDFDAHAWVQVYSRSLTTLDTTAVHTVSDTGKFIDDETGRLQAKFSFRATGPVLVYPWSARVDLVNWTVLP
jgi:hypothetical protein